MKISVFWDIMSCSLVDQTKHNHIPHTVLFNIKIDLRLGNGSRLYANCGSGTHLFCYHRIAKNILCVSKYLYFTCPRYFEGMRESNP
jgi:hypothetical protein